MSLACDLIKEARAVKENSVVSISMARSPSAYSQDGKLFSPPGSVSGEIRLGARNKVLNEGGECRNLHIEIVRAWM